MRAHLYSKYFAVALLAGILFCGPHPARSADDGGRITRPMTAVDSVTLLADGTTVSLWGIKPPPSAAPLQLKALDLLDSMIGDEPVDCKIVNRNPSALAPGNVPEMTARCTSSAGADLGLELLTHGYAVIDRRQIAGSVFAAAYAKAQEAARLNEKGVWRAVAAEDKELHVPEWAQEYLSVLLPGVLIAWPLVILLIGMALMLHWMKRVSAMQKEESERSHHKEAILLARERNVLISTLEGELSENKNKISAFLAIYGDMLSSLKSTEEAPKYQRVGDIVQKRPSLSKTVFESHVGKLSLLDIRLAGKLSKLYTSMTSEREYINLDPGVPLEEAIRIVEGALKEAEELFAALDQAIHSLEAAAAKPVEDA